MGAVYGPPILEARWESGHVLRWAAVCGQRSSRGIIPGVEIFLI